MANVQSTSAEAFRTVDLNKRQAEVFQALRRIEPACNLDIVDATGIPTNVVTPRMLELREAGLVVESHRAVTRTGRRAIFWQTAEGASAAVLAHALLSGAGV